MTHDGRFQSPPTHAHRLLGHSYIKFINVLGIVRVVLVTPWTSIRCVVCSHFLLHVNKSWID